MTTGKAQTLPLHRRLIDMGHSELLCDISVFSLVRPRPADPDCDLPPSEHVPLGRPGDDRRDEVQQLPPAGGGEEVPGGQL